MDDWNDFRLVLALARQGSLPKAAVALKVNPSTAYRRLNALENRLGTRLFARDDGSYLPTETGDRMALAAERIEAEALTLAREISGGDRRLAGCLRVTASETLAFGVLTEILGQFRTAHPGIQIELTVDNRELDLSRREADVALRASRPAQPHLFGRKLADIAWGLYGSREYLEGHGAPAELGELNRFSIIGWEADARVKAAEWLTATVPAECIVYASNSLINQCSAAKASIGLAVLPCYLGDREPLLRRVMPAPLPLTRELWLITHRDLRHAARVRAFFDLVGAAIATRRALLEGTAP